MYLNCCAPVSNRRFTLDPPGIVYLSFPCASLDGASDQGKYAQTTPLNYSETAVKGSVALCFKG